MARPQISWRDGALVALGGAIGVGLRALVLLPDGDVWVVWGVPAVNVLGAFALGLVTGWAAHLGTSPRARTVRILVGTGVLGGFTTYSSFAVAAVHGEALWITIATAAAGVLAAWAGLVLSRPRVPRAHRVRGVVPENIDDGGGRR